MTADDEGRRSPVVPSHVKTRANQAIALHDPHTAVAPLVHDSLLGPAGAARHDRHLVFAAPGIRVEFVATRTGDLDITVSPGAGVQLALLTADGVLPLATGEDGVVHLVGVDGVVTAVVHHVAGTAAGEAIRTAWVRV